MTEGEKNKKPTSVSLIFECFPHLTAPFSNPYQHHYHRGNMKIAVLSSLAVSTAAFVSTTKTATRSSSLNVFEDEVGAMLPLGFFDPLGLVADGNKEKFDRLRYVELKHGRICQLAFLGQIVTRAGYHFPGTLGYEDRTFDSYPNGLAALFGPEAIPNAGLLQIVGFIGFLELAVMKDITGGEFPGDFRNDSLDFGWDSFDAETKLSKRAIELNNGRAAMMGILGLMVHEQLGGELPIVGPM